MSAYSEGADVDMGIVKKPGRKESTKFGLNLIQKIYLTATRWDYSSTNFLPKSLIKKAKNVVVKKKLNDRITALFFSSIVGEINTTYYCPAKYPAALRSAKIDESRLFRTLLVLSEGTRQAFLALRLFWLLVLPNRI